MNATNTSITTLPEDIIPVPEYKKKKTTRDKQGKTAVVTSSPYIKELTIEEVNRQVKEQLAELKKENRELKKNKNPKTAKKNQIKSKNVIESDEGEPTCSSLQLTSSKKFTKKSKKIKIKKELFKSSLDDDQPATSSNAQESLEPGKFVLVRFVLYAVKGTSNNAIITFLNRHAADSYLHS